MSNLLTQWRIDFTGRWVLSGQVVMRGSKAIEVLAQFENSFPGMDVTAITEIEAHG